MAQDTYQVVMEVAGALTATSNLVHGLGTLEDAFKKLAKEYTNISNVSTKFDLATGKLVGATLTGIDKTGAKVANTMSLVTKKINGVATSSVHLTSASKGLASAHKYSSETVDNFLTSIAKLPSRLTSISAATDKQKQAYANALRDLNAYTEANKVSAGQLANVWSGAGRLIQRSPLLIGLEKRLLAVKDLASKILVTEANAGEAAAKANAKANAKAQALSEAAARAQAKANSKALEANVKSGEQQAKHFERLRVSILRQADAYAKVAASAAKATEQADRLALGSKLGTAATGLVAGSTDRSRLAISNTSQQAQYTGALSALERLVSKHRISTTDIAKMWGDVSQGIVTRQVGALAQVQTALQRVHHTQQQLGVSGQGMLVSWTSFARFFEARTLYSAIQGFASNIAQARVDAQDFEQTLSRIRTLSSDSDNSLKSWSVSVKAISNQFGSDALDVAKSYYSALSNQIGETTADIEQFTRITTQFAQVTGATSEQSNNLFSSAINAFKLNVHSSQEIAAKFFKAIDLGRITAQGLSGSFGRVSVAASTLGVSLEETLAGLSTLSRLGVTDADAMTQMLNLFNKLIKPSEELKKVFQDWGVASGEAAISAFGFTGVVAKLSQELESNGLSRLGELVTDIRAFRAIIGLAGPNLKDYTRDLNEITNSASSYGDKVSISFESAGKTVQIELNKVRNSFLTVGQGINELIAFFTRNVTSLVTVLKTGLIVAVTGAAYVLGATLIPAVIAAQARVAAWVVMLRTTRVALIGVQAAMGPVAAVLALVGTVAVSSWLTAQDTIEATTEKMNLMVSDAQAASAKVASETQKIFDTLKSRIAKSAADQTAVLNKNIADQIRLIDGLKAGLKYSEEAALNAIDARLSASKRRVTDYTSLLDYLTNSVAEFKNKMADDAFKDSIANLDPKAQVAAIQAEIARNTAAAQALAKSANDKEAGAQVGRLLKENLELIDRVSEIKEKADEAEKKRLQDIIDLKERIAETEAEMATKARELAAANRSKGLSEQEAARLTRDQIRLAERKLEAEARLNKKQTPSSRNTSASKRDALALKLDKQQSAEYLADLKAENAEQKQANDLATANAKLTKQKVELKTLETSGKVPVAEDMLNALKQQQAETAESIIADVKERILEAGELERAEMRKTEAERFVIRRNYDQLENFTKSEHLKLFTDKNGIINTDAANAALADLIQRMAASAAIYGTDATHALDEAINKSGILQGIQNEINQQAQKSAVDSVSKQRLVALTLLEAKHVEINKLMESQRKKAVELGNEISDINTVSDRVNEAVKTAVVDGLVTPEELKQLSALIQTARKALSTGQFGLIGSIGGPGAVNANKFEHLDQVLRHMAGITSSLATNEKTYAELTTALSTYKTEADRAAEATAAIGTRAEEAAVRVDNSVKAMIESMRALDRASAYGLPQAGPVEGHATGGSIGSRSNTDSILASLTRGEFVVNRASAAKFRPMLTAMNHNMSSGGVVGGSTSNTSVGDINVTLQSTGRVTDDVAAIGRELKRSIRNGRLRL